MPYNAGEIMQDSTYDKDEILVQGVKDCVLQNGYEITINDYKTDFVLSMKQLKSRYTKQLEMYRQGARQLFGTDKVKCILYSFHLGEYTEF